MSKLILAKIIDKAKDEIVEKYADNMVDHVQSDEFKEKLATKINKKIDIPFVSEEKEQVFFEKCVDLVTDVIEGIVKK
jgi:predicted ArsR family transcriptional regulator